MGKESAILDYVPHAAADGEQTITCHHFAVYLYFSFIRRDEADDEAQKGRLAAAAGADEAGGGTGGEIEVYLLHGNLRAVGAGDPAQAYGRVRHGEYLDEDMGPFLLLNVTALKHIKGIFQAWSQEQLLHRCCLQSSS
jgi:hypothetical protein